MSIFLQRVSLLLFAAILQRSFFDILWPSLAAPVLILSVVVALVFLLGFERALGWVMVALQLFMLLGEVGIFPVFAIGVAYGTNFLSRRLLIEHRFQSSLTLSLMTAGAASIYLFGSAVSYGSTVTTMQIIGSVLEALLVFPLVLTVLRFSEESIQAGQMSEFRGLRT